MAAASPSPSGRSLLRRRLLCAVVGASLALQPFGLATVAIPTAQAQETPAKTDSTQAIYAPSRLPAPSAPATSPPSTLPDLGDESQSLISPVQERKLGESVVREIRAAGAYLEDPEVNDYLNELGYRMVAAVPDTTQNSSSLRGRRSNDQCLCAARRLCRRETGADPADADRVGARCGARARNHARDAAPLTRSMVRPAAISDLRPRGAGGRHRRVAVAFVVGRPATNAAIASAPVRSRFSPSSTTRARTSMKRTARHPAA
jgi:hypothetical protein